MLDYAQLLGMNGGNAQAATLMQGALQPGASMLNAAGPTPVGQNPMTGGPSRFSMGTAIGEAGQPGTLMGQAAQQVAAAPPRPAPYGGLYVDPMGKVYAYNQATQNRAPWTNREAMSYGVNEGGAG